MTTNSLIEQQLLQRIILLEATLQSARAEIVALHAEAFNGCDGTCSYEEFIKHTDQVLAQPLAANTPT